MEKIKYHRVWPKPRIYFPWLFLVLGLGVCFPLPMLFGRAQSFIPTTVEIRLVCGDGYAEHLSGEFCDPGEPPLVPPDVGTSTCADFNDIFGNPYLSGDLTCLSDCTAYWTVNCYNCGNGYKEPAEECDSADLGGLSCIGLGYRGGTLSCLISCRISTINCEAAEEPGGTPGAGSGGGAAGGATGYQPGSLGEQVTKVVMRGKSYPNADVHILADGKVIGIVTTDAKADFYFETSEISPGVVSFGFWSEDQAGLKSTLLTLTLRVISRAVTTISGVYISPTIEIDKKSVRQGEGIRIYGQTVPETEVHVHINSEQEFVEQVSSQADGGWELPFDTTPLEEDFHLAKALFQVNVEGNVIQSGFSRAVSFYVGQVGGEAVCPEADLNGDGRVNLTDFSILLYYWGTDNACADQNQNGVVDLVDFSIMMYYWTG
ncbi:MAG: dockerin type I repeat-containing protein [Planctomycetes bacterium]|nr:dockerin type I repeat-containing protein [Planctomycetota bacterium]